MSKKGELKQITCTLEKDVVAMARKIVGQYDLFSMSSFINDCVKFSMDNLEVMMETDEEWIRIKQFFISGL